MDYGAVLDVGVVSDCDGMNIAPHYGIEPHGAIVAHNYLADYSCVVGQKTVRSEFWSNTTNRFYQRHNPIFFEPRKYGIEVFF
jgi:hypothetical protein